MTSWPRSVSSSRRLAHRLDVRAGSGRSPIRSGLRRPADAQRGAARPAPPRRSSIVGSGAVESSPSVVPADHVVDERGVEHGPGQRPGRAQRPPEVLHRRGRHPTALRLEAEEPAAGRRDPDRPATVAADTDRHHAGRDRHGGAAARATGRVPGLPRVARVAAVDRLGVGPLAELRHPGLADDDRAGGAQPAHELAVGRQRASSSTRPPKVVTHPATSISSLIAIGTPCSGPGGPPVGERPVARGSLGARLVGQDDGEGVEGRVALGDPGEAGLDDLDRGDLLLARSAGPARPRSGPPGGQRVRRQWSWAEG